ncbi:MAG: hypothetical protein ACRCXX_01375, partial [Cetobacterium sp.]
ICQNINKEIKKIKIGEHILSSSIGLINLRYDKSIITNFNFADKALYESKRSGRGKVTMMKK